MPQQGNKEETRAARAELDAKQAQIRQQAEIDTKQLEIDYLRTQLEPSSLPTSPPSHRWGSSASMTKCQRCWIWVWTVSQPHRDPMSTMLN